MTRNTDTRPEIWKSRRQGGPTIVTDDTTAGKPTHDEHERPPNHRQGSR